MQAERRLIELTRSQHHLATRDLVTKAGLSPDQWDRLTGTDVWLQIVPGVWRHEATPATWEMNVIAGSLWLGPDAALHGASAGRWLGMEGCDTERVGFLTPRARRHLPPWLELHTTLQWTKGDTVLRNSVRTSNATRAIIDMAKDASPQQLETAIDSAIRMRLTAVPRLTRRIGELSGSGRAGIRMLRTLMLDAGGESDLERRFLRLMRVHGFERPHSQIVYRSNGRTMRVDFEWPNQNVVAEVSGRLGHSSERDQQREIHRRNELQRRGKRYIEFSTADVIGNPDYVLETVGTYVPVISRPRKGR
jgi:very-short-patch-repair endonuclease